MPSPVRAHTNLANVEHAPFAHKYLLKRPKTHEHERIDDDVEMESSSEDATHIDNPAVEKRESHCSE